MISSRTRQRATSPLSHAASPPAPTQPKPASARGILQPSIRTAGATDLDALVTLERQSFESDRLSRRSYGSLLYKASALVMVAELNGALAGSLVLLFNSSTSISRVYSLAVARPCRGRGVARALLLAATHAAQARECLKLQLEVRVDNRAARALYASEGFEFVRYVPNYYADGADAVRVQRTLFQMER